ncbi:MAG: hypothetical protein K5849_00780 [Bacteroidales bacterium]|nr:hypothetical protein [Bacteroidales bacterium]
MKTLFNKVWIAASLLAAAAFTVQAQTHEGAVGGVFRLEEEADAGEMARKGEVNIIYDGSGNAWFEINVRRADGQTATLSPANGEWVPTEGRKLTYNWVTDTFDYSVVIDLVSLEGIVVTEQENAGASPFGKGITLGGAYSLDYGTVPDTKGYMYQRVSEGSALELCAGGRYRDAVQLPEFVDYQGEHLPVVGIAEKAFYGNKAVRRVQMANDKQYARQSAYYRSGIFYSWNQSFDLPGYVYPDADYFTFVRPTVKEWTNFDAPSWVLFKHNYAPLTFVKDRSKDETARWGYSPLRAEEMQGAYYEMRVPDAVRKEMFRGYQYGEVIGLIAGSDFLAQHRFPAFNRWKYPEKEVSMGAAFDKQMEQRYGRKVKQSRYVGNLREGDGKLGICEFEITDGEAMVVYAWTVGGKVKATYVLTADINPDYGASGVWNVDDEGEYGIPQLLCVAFDHHDNVILFLNHPAPESINLFGLRQQGDQLVLFGEDSWYVFVD